MESHYRVASSNGRLIASRTLVAARICSFGGPCSAIERCRSDVVPPTTIHTLYRAIASEAVVVRGLILPNQRIWILRFLFSFLSFASFFTLSEQRNAISMTDIDFDTTPALWPPPPGANVNFTNPENIHTLIRVTVALCLGVSSLLVLLRIWARALIVKQVSWDDCE